MQRNRSLGTHWTYHVGGCARELSDRTVAYSVFDILSDFMSSSGWSGVFKMKSKEPLKSRECLGIENRWNYIAYLCTYYLKSPFMSKM